MAPAAPAAAPQTSVDSAGRTRFSTGGMRSASFAASAVLVAALAATPRAFAAEPPVANKVAAEALYEEAKPLLSQRQWQPALDKLLASQRLDPAIGTLLNIAYCYEQLGKTASAWATYNEVVGMARASGDRQGRGERAAQAAAALAPKLARVVVTVPRESRVERLEVKRDGEPIDPGTWDTGIPTDPGPHTFEASAPGRATWRASVEVPPGPSTATVTVPLLDVASSWSPQRTAGLAVAGVGVAAAIAGGIFGGLAIARKNAERSHCLPSDPHLCDATGVSLRSQALTMANASNVAFAVGGAALVAGVAVFFTAPKPGGGSASLGLSPTVAAHEGGLRLTGRW